MIKDQLPQQSDEPRKRPQDFPGMLARKESDHGLGASEKIVDDVRTNDVKGLSGNNGALSGRANLDAELERPLVSNGLTDQGKEVLKLIRDAMITANQCRRDIWDFAVEISELTKRQIPRHVLRQLVCQRLIMHRREVPSASENSRAFKSENNVVLSDNSCFVLTPTGRDQADFLAEQADEKERLMEGRELFFNDTTEHLPTWDSDAREFRLGSILVKRFKWPARNQEQILRAFQQKNWPQKIMNPLPEDVVVCRKAQLHDTIKCLNRNQVNMAIKFRGDGTGNGVFWEIVPDYKTKSNGSA